MVDITTTYLLNTNKLQLCATATNVLPEGGDYFILSGPTSYPCGVLID